MHTLQDTQLMVSVLLLDFTDIKLFLKRSFSGFHIFYKFLDMKPIQNFSKASERKVQENFQQKLNKSSLEIMCKVLRKLQEKDIKKIHKR